MMYQFSVMPIKLLNINFDWIYYSVGEFRCQLCDNRVILRRRCSHLFLPGQNLDPILYSIKAFAWLRGLKPLSSPSFRGTRIYFTTFRWHSIIYRARLTQFATFHLQLNKAFWKVTNDYDTAYAYAQKITACRKCNLI